MERAAGQRPVPRVPGLVLERSIGRGAHGQVWLARDLGSEERVAVKLRTGPPGPGGPGAAADGQRAAPDGSAEAALRLADEVAVLTRIDHPHVVRLRRAVDLPDGSRALVLDLAAGGSLAGLVAARGRLDPAEVSTVVVGIARALAHLHSRGLVHGDLTPGNVLFTGSGRPLLSDLGVASVLGADGGRPEWGTTGFSDPAPGPAGDPARDVWSLGAVAAFALGDPSPGGPGPRGPQHGPLADLVRECTDAQAALRPEAMEVARAAWEAVRPAPIRLLPGIGAGDGVTSRGQVPVATTTAAAPVTLDVDVTRRVRELARGGSGDGPGDPRRAGAGQGRPPAPPRRRGRLLAAGALLVAATAAVAAATLVPGWLPGAGAAAVPATPSARPPAGGCTSAEGSPQGLARTVCALAEGRARAFGAASSDPLTQVDAPGSPALAADSGLVSRLAAGGLHLEGLTFVVREVRLTGSAPGRLTVAAQVSTSAHRQVRADGSVAATVAATPAVAVRLVLVSGPGGSGWRVSTVG